MSLDVWAGGLRAALVAGLAIALLPGHSRGETLETEQYRVRAEVVADGLHHPWAVAFLPDGRFLVSERRGRLLLITEGVEEPVPVSGVPTVLRGGQGGLLDVVLHPGFDENRWVYLAYSKEVDGRGRTALARGRLAGATLEEVSDLFVAENSGSSSRHYGARIVFGADHALYLALGERGDADDAQNLDDHKGVVVRLNDDGSVPTDNPFASDPDALPEIYSYGHRNPQGFALRPGTDELWLTEHGPRGGDEVNRVEPGVNYGWPVITHGRAYSGFSIGEGDAKEGMAQPLLHWTPSIAPSGATFYAGDLFPEWRGDFFAGALKHEHVARLEIAGGEIVHEEQMFRDAFGRIRDVREGPDGGLYLLTDERNGQLIRIRPDE